MTLTLYIIAGGILFGGISVAVDETVGRIWSIVTLLAGTIVLSIIGHKLFF